MQVVEQNIYRYDGLSAPVAQLDRVLVSETKGRRFDPSRARQFSTLNQKYFLLVN